MKNKLYILSLLLFYATNVTIADNSSYFPEKMEWTTLIFSSGDCGEGVIGGAYCVLQGDTIINDNRYQIVIYNDNLILPILEINKRIYVHSHHNDYLLYDFNMEVGDTMPTFIMDECTSNVYKAEDTYVSKIDTISLMDGRRAKRIFYEFDRVEDIEYIGNYEGLLGPLRMIQIPMCWAYLKTCCSSNGEPLYETTPGFCNGLDQHDALYYHEASPSPIATKLFRDGQLLIQNGDKLYTPQGTEVK